MSRLGPETRGETTTPEPARPLPRPGALAQLGLLRRLFSDPVPVLDELRADHGPIVGLGIGPVRLAVVGDPTMLRELFGLPVERFRWGHRYNVLEFIVGSGSMLVSDGEDHNRRRSSVQGAFSRKRLNAWVPMILERTDASVDGLLAGIPVGGAEVDALVRSPHAWAVDGPAGRGRRCARSARCSRGGRRAHGASP